VTETETETERQRERQFITNRTARTQDNKNVGRKPVTHWHRREREQRQRQRHRQRQRQRHGEAGREEDRQSRQTEMQTDTYYRDTH
jgi:hypothetical protein